MQKCFTKTVDSNLTRKDLYLLHRNTAAPKAAPTADPPPPLPLRIAPGAAQKAAPVFLGLPFSFRPVPPRPGPSMTFVYAGLAPDSVDFSPSCLRKGNSDEKVFDSAGV